MQHAVTLGPKWFPLLLKLGLALCLLVVAQPATAKPVQFAQPFDAGTIGSLASVVLINGVPAPIVPGPFPGAVNAFYTAGFHIGVIRAGRLDMRLVSATTSCRPQHREHHRRAMTEHR